jgi:hypothetical protein
MAIKGEREVKPLDKYTEPNSSMKQRFWVLEPEAACLISAPVIAFRVHLAVSRAGLHWHINLQIPYKITDGSEIYCFNPRKK